MIDFFNNTFYLNTADSSYVMGILEDGIFVHQYYGKKVQTQNMDFYHLRKSYDYTAAYIANGETTTMDALPLEFPTQGRGDYRTPAIVIKGEAGRAVNDLRYSFHRIFEGVPAMDGLPCLDRNTEKVQTLEIVLQDTVTKAEVHLFYSVFEDSDIIARNTVIKNRSDTDLSVVKCASVSVDFEQSDYDMISLYGRWANERSVEKIPLRHGQNVVSSTRGASGHHSTPFVALASKNATEDYGDVYGVSLIYSGDFEIGADVGQFDNARLFAGINHEDFSWELKPNESFVAPQAVLTFSSNGIGKMSRNFHEMCRHHLGVCADRPVRPVLLNLWEAFYFDISEEKVLDAIRNTQGTGIDTVVIDDGWFGKRQNEFVSMGDWYINVERFPNGFHNIIDECRKNHLKLGLWFEPEMVGKESDFIKEHPDWYVHVEGLEPVVSRGEYVLDLCRDEVIDSVFEKISGILSKYDISYIKWDMNRNVTDFGSPTLPASRQGEFKHRYILGLYQLIGKIKKAFPDLYIEGSAGGGGRFDFGMLYYMPQIWCSDNSDAIERLNIQHGTSMVYPPETISAHVSAVPNHQTNRVTPFDTRKDVAQMFAFGYELNLNIINESEKSSIFEQIAKHKELKSWMFDGDFYRLSDFDANDYGAWQIVSKDKKKSVALYVVKLTKAKRIGRYFRLKGLDCDKNYRIDLLGLTLSGDFIMYAGLPIKNQLDDFESLFFQLDAD